MKIALGSDHAGFTLRNHLSSWLRTPEGGGHQVLDLGCPSTESCDYPDYAAAVARAVASGRVARGILLCGTGIGMSIAANKVPGVRAALTWNPTTAALAAEHNKANVVCLPARFIGPRKAEAILSRFLKAEFSRGRHVRRLRKIKALDRCAG